MLTDGGNTPEQRLAFAFRRATARAPDSTELQVLKRGLERYRRRFLDNVDTAQRFIQQGESPAAEKLDAVELAAYTAVASVILNLDETITKE